MIYVLGVDPGSISGWALLAGNLGGRIRLLAYGHTGRPGEPTNGANIREVLHEIGKILPGAWPPTLAIEELFLKTEIGRHEKDRHKAIGTLSCQGVRGRWLGLAEAYGCPVWEHKPKQQGVPVYAWRRAEWGKASWPTEQAKAQAIKAAKLVFDVEIPKTHHHTAEAAFIGRFVAATIREQRRLERQKESKADDGRDKRSN